MQSTLLFLGVCMMFSGVHGVSQSMSCSTVNGKRICNRQTSEGNAAMASSISATGMGSDYQQTYAGAGGPGQFDSSSQTVRGGSPGGYSNPSSSYSYTNTQQAPSGAYGGPTGVSSFSSSGAAPNLGYVGGYSGGGSPGGYVGGFAAAGSFPFPAVSGYGYPPQGSSSYSSSSSSSGGAPAQGPSNTDQQPQMPMTGPMAFVNQFMGGGAFAGGGGAFAAAGFPFGRR